MAVAIRREFLDGRDLKAAFITFEDGKILLKSETIEIIEKDTKRIDGINARALYASGVLCTT